jgi:hypothetical protein
VQQEQNSCRVPGCHNLCVRLSCTFSPKWGATSRTCVLELPCQNEAGSTLEENQRKPQSQLFTVRVWTEHLGNEHVEWRGQVQHVMSGETSFFRDWETLIRFLTSIQSDASAENELSDM